VPQRTTTAVAILAGALLAVTSCDANTGGSTTPETTTDEAGATEALWDPCTQISDDVLQQVGVDPTTRNNKISGVEYVEGWKLCSWHDKAVRWDYRLGVWATTHTTEESKEDENNIGFTDISIADRTGVQFKRADDAHDEQCFLSFPSGNQSIEISIYKSVLTKDQRGPCEIATAAANTLVPIFPK